MPWQELVDYSETHDLLAKRLYVVFSEPTDGLGPVVHQAGARTFRIRPWLLNEGTLGVQVFLSGGKPKVL
jgi:hypothetical protein